MRLRNGEHGYGAVTKTLHWLTVALIAAQFWVGYAMEADGDGPDVDCDPPGEDRRGGDITDAEDARLDRLEDACEARLDRLDDAADDRVDRAWSALWSGDLGDVGLGLPTVHVLVGLGILLVAVLRVSWRATTPLPPWDTRLSAFDRKALPIVERVLLGLLFVVPLSGLALVLVSDDWLPLHVAAHVTFFAALAIHVGIVVRRRVVGRMLPGGRTGGP
jgi:cytochrome b561